MLRGYFQVRTELSVSVSRTCLITAGEIYQHIGKLEIVKSLTAVYACNAQGICSLMQIRDIHRQDNFAETPVFRRVIDKRIQKIAVDANLVILLCALDYQPDFGISVAFLINSRYAYITKNQRFSETEFLKETQFLKCSQVVCVR